MNSVFKFTKFASTRSTTSHVSLKDFMKRLIYCRIMSIDDNAYLHSTESCVLDRIRSRLTRESVVLRPRSDPKPNITVTESVQRGRFSIRREA